MMKTNALIIDLRRQLPWHRRYMSTTTTAVLWGVWLLLWRPMMMILGIIGVENHHWLHHITLLFLTALEKGMIMITLCALVLLLWNNLVPTKLSKRSPAKTDQDYARYFALDQQAIANTRTQKISTVYHDEHGKIISIQ